MKKLFTFIFVVVMIMCGTSAFALESLLIAETGGGTFSGASQYFSTGAIEGVSFQTQQISGYSGGGIFPRVLIYSSSGPLYREEMFAASSGYLSTTSRTGTDTLTLFEDPNNAAITFGVLDQRAVGVSNNLVGTEFTSNTITKTNGGLVLQTETVGMFSSASVNVGGIIQVTAGSGPTGGGEGERSSAITEYFKDRYRFKAFTGGTLPGVPLAIQYSVSFNPIVSLIPAPIVP